MKKSAKEKVHFMKIAETSLLELEAQNEISMMLNYWTGKNYQEFDKKRSEAGHFLYRYRSKITA